MGLMKKDFNLSHFVTIAVTYVKKHIVTCAVGVVIDETGQL